MTIQRLDANSERFSEQLDALLAWSSVSDPAVAATVAEILQAIKSQGDTALMDYTNQFDRRDISQMAELTISQAQLQQALESIPVAQRQALEVAA